MSQSTEYNPEIYYRNALNDPKSGLPNPTIIPGLPNPLQTNTMAWIDPVQAPDGARTQFAFMQQPVYCSFNGVNQFFGTGYNMVFSGGQYLVTFIDANGATLTPQTGDIIKAETI